MSLSSFFFINYSTIIFTVIVNNINRINKFYGTDFISQIIIKNKHQSNNTNNMSKISNQYKKSPSVKFRVNTDGIKDDSLRNALEKLGRNIKES